MKTKYEYTVVSKDDETDVWATGIMSRENAREEKRYVEIFHEVPVKIIQKKYELASVKVVR